MSSLSVGSTFPSGVKLSYIPYNKESADVKACGFPIPLDLDKELANKKVVLVGAPGAFTPACMNNHIPPFGEHIADFKKKGVDDIVVITANDPFVLSAWAKVLDLNDKFKFASDPNAEFTSAHGLSMDATAKGLGIRTKRFAIVVDNGKITYLGVEPNPGDVTISGAEAVLAKL